MTGRHVASRRAGLTLNAYIGPVVAGNVVTDNSVRHLKHNSWPTPRPSVIGVELLGAAVNQWRADLQHTLATQRLR